MSIFYKICINNIIRSTVVIVFSICALSVHSEELSKRRIVFESQSNNVDYRLALGSLRKINNTVSASHEQRLSGNLARISYEFDRDLSAGEAWALSLSYLPNLPIQNVYACDGLACGSSNAWANDQFEIKELYGLDQYQKYRVYKIEANPTQFLVMYFVVRGNKRIYLHLDTITVAGVAPEILPSKEAIISTLNEQGYFIVSLSADAQVNDKLVENIAATFSSNPRLNVYIVGHSKKSNSLEPDRLQAMKYAESLSQKLIAKGVKKARMDLQSLAYLAPRQLQASERIELLIKGS